MRKASIQIVATCMVLAVTMGTADAIYFSNMFTPAEELINGAQPWGAAEEVRIGSSNFINGPGNFDGNMRVVPSAGAVTSGRLYVGFSGALNSGNLIIDGTSWTGSSVLHLGQNASNGAGGDELSVVEIINGGSLIVSGTEMGQNGGGRLIVDNSTFSTGSGHFSGNGPGNTFVTIRNGSTAGAGFTSLGLSGGSGTSTLNVEGAGSVYNGAAFYLGGGSRDAFVNVTGGGTANSDNFFCSFSAGGGCDVLISGVGSLITGSHNLDIGLNGPATMTLEEGGLFTHNGLPANPGRDVDVASAATLNFGIGNGSKIGTVADATIADGATVGVKFDSGFLPTPGAFYDLVTVGGTFTINPGALLLDDQTGPNWIPSLSTSGGALQVSFVPEPATMMLMAFGGLLVACSRRRG